MRIIWIPEAQEFRKIKYAKVYHVNVVFKLEYLDDTQQNRVQYKKMRFVLDQNGIKRVVELLSILFIIKSFQLCTFK